MAELTVVEICSGAGGQSLGLEQAGFAHVAAFDIDGDSCRTLRANRPKWEIAEADVRELDGLPYRGIDLLAGGVPCPPFSIAGKQLGELDERDLFPEALRLADEIRPRAILLENVRGFATPRFAAYRRLLSGALESMGYIVFWNVLNAMDFEVPQYRPRFILVALREEHAGSFIWPSAKGRRSTVSQTISDLMGSRGWPGLTHWKEQANQVAPTIVGGSKKHGGPDLGPTRARSDWRKLGVDGRSIAELAPDENLPEDALPRLTVRMVARIQGFPDSWAFTGTKTSSYKQVGNAFPPPVARAVGRAIGSALNNTGRSASRQLSLLTT